MHSHHRVKQCSLTNAVGFQSQRSRLISIKAQGRPALASSRRDSSERNSICSPIYPGYPFFVVHGHRSLTHQLNACTMRTISSAWIPHFAHPFDVFEFLASHIPSALLPRPDRTQLSTSSFLNFHSRPICGLATAFVDPFDKSYRYSHPNDGRFGMEAHRSSVSVIMPSRIDIFSLKGLFFNKS